MALPIGWTIDNGEPISPWAVLGDKAWPKDAKKSEGPVCSKTGRPASRVPAEATYTVEQVLPPARQEFKNPYGNGEFKVSVGNPTEKELEIPALLTDGKKILWADSVLAFYGDQPKILPGAGKATSLEPVRLKPGETVSGIVDVLPLDGISYPGGARIYFDFVLGDRVANNFYYHLNNFHGPLREAALKKLKAAD
jgi:hypothetical protein